MAIKFFNIRSKETRVADSEPMIAAMFNSSDKGPNALVGQDFGWRLAPEVVVEMRRIRNDPRRIQEIANNFQKPYNEVGETDILKYISDKTSVASAPVAIEGDYEDEYKAAIAKLEKAGKPRSRQVITDDEFEEDEMLATPLDKGGKPEKNKDEEEEELSE